MAPHELANTTSELCNLNSLKEVPLSDPEINTDPEEGYQSCYQIQRCTQTEIILNNHAYTATVKNPVLKPDDTAYWKSGRIYNRFKREETTTIQCWPTIRSLIAIPLTKLKPNQTLMVSYTLGPPFDNQKFQFASGIISPAKEYKAQTCEVHIPRQSTKMDQDSVHFTMKNTTNKTQHVSGTVAFFLVNKDKRNNVLTDPHVKIEGDKVITASAIIIPPRNQKKIMVKIHYPSYKSTEEVLFLPHNVTSASGDKPLVILGAVTTPDKDRFIIDVINHNVTPIRIPKDAFLGTVQKLDRSWLEEIDPVKVNTNQVTNTQNLYQLSLKKNWEQPLIKLLFATNEPPKKSHN